MPKVSIVIRTKNEEEFIGKTLEKVFSQTFRDIEVIIVDSGSTDSTLDIVNGFKTKIVTIEPQEFTYGYALNVGISATRGEFIVNLSADAVPVNEDWLGCLLFNFTDEQAAGVYGRQISMPGANPLVCLDLNRRYEDEKKVQKNDVFFSNVNAMIRKRLWEECPFDETLPGCEDLAWAKEVQKLGYYIIYEPKAVVFHSINNTLYEVYNRSKREARGSKILNPELRMRFWGLRTCLYLTVKDMIYLYKNGFNFKYFLYSPIFRFVKSFGTYRGFLE